MSSEYENIINYPHHKSTVREAMSISERAAQFAPFAALTGHSDVIKEVARLTEKRIELDESEKVQLNNRLHYLKSHIADNNMVLLTYFKADNKKTGGVYITERTVIIRIKEYERLIILKSGDIIPIDDVLRIEGDCFNFDTFV